MHPDDALLVFFAHFLTGVRRFVGSTLDLVQIVPFAAVEIGGGVRDVCPVLCEISPVGTPRFEGGTDEAVIEVTEKEGILIFPMSALVLTLHTRELD